MAVVQRSGAEGVNEAVVVVVVVVVEEKSSRSRIISIFFVLG